MGHLGRNRVSEPAGAGFGGLARYRVGPGLRLHGRLLCGRGWTLPRVALLVCEFVASCPAGCWPVCSLWSCVCCSTVLYCRLYCIVLLYCCIVLLYCVVLYGVMHIYLC